MAKRKNINRIIFVVLIFIAYFFIGARPIPRETVLAARWISSIENESPAAEQIHEQLHQQMPLTPFTLGSRFGYVDTSGQFAMNQIRTGEIFLCENHWVQHDAQPSIIEIMNTAGQTVLSFDSLRGYPILLDNRIFLLGSDQNKLSEIDTGGNVIWTFEFGAPLTTIDVAAGLVLTGSLDGIVEILDSQGRRIFHLEPGGSRYSVILGSAFSRDGMRFGIISGIDQQRFILLERTGSGFEYQIVHHEFLGEGFRRPVRISFIDNDQRIVFERLGGIGSYAIRSRQSIFIPIDGEIAAMDESGYMGFFFLVNSLAFQHKELIGIKFPAHRFFPFFRNRQNMRDTIFIRAPFFSEDVFLNRSDSTLIVGGGTTLVSFELEER